MGARTDRMPAVIRAVIVDDEELARGLLREMLAGHPDIEVAAECANGFEAVKAVGELKPDLLLLDIQMPKLDGFDVLELIGADVAVIFVTAYDSFAIRAFEVHAVDYLLKPFGPERLADALARARTRVAGRQPLRAGELARAAGRQQPPLGRVLIRDRSDVHVIPVEKIDYIEAQDDYAAFKVGGRTLLKEQTLGELETLLDPRRFVRIHRRYLLNITRLAKIESSDTDSKTAVLATGDELPISRAGFVRLRELL